MIAPGRPSSVFFYPGDIMHLDTIYVIHHTHTDVGFTNDQPIFWEMHYRFIDDALHLIERFKENLPESRFRWTVETTCGLEAWLKTASHPR